MEASHSWFTASTPLPPSSGPLKTLSLNVKNCILDEDVGKSKTPTQKRAKECARHLGMAQRTRTLYNLLTRPPLLCCPSLGIRLPFNPKGGTSVKALEKASSELKELSLADPCLLSVDGLLDTFFACRNAIAHLWEEYEKEVALSEKEDDTVVATMNVLDLNLTRSEL